MCSKRLCFRAMCCPIGLFGHYPSIVPQPASLVGISHLSWHPCRPSVTHITSGSYLYACSLIAFIAVAEGIITVFIKNTSSRVKYFFTSTGIFSARAVYNPISFTSFITCSLFVMFRNYGLLPVWSSVGPQFWALLQAILSRGLKCKTKCPWSVLST